MIFADVPNRIAAKNAVKGRSISIISTRRLVVATNAVKYYTAIGRMTKFDNMHYINVLGEFNTDYDVYVLLKRKTSPEVPLVSDKYKDKKIIKWLPLFEDKLLRTLGSKFPLVYIVRDNYDIPDVRYYPLTENAHYGASGSTLRELIDRLHHSGIIFRDDNKNVFIMISKDVAGTSVESKIKS